MAPFRKLAAKVANEPIVHLAGTVQSGLVWLFTYVVTGWDPSTHQQQLAGFATAGAYALAFIARQFVTPVAKPVTPATPVTTETVAINDPTGAATTAPVTTTTQA